MLFTSLGVPSQRWCTCQWTDWVSSFAGSNPRARNAGQSPRAQSDSPRYSADRTRLSSATVRASVGSVLQSRLAHSSPCTAYCTAWVSYCSSVFAYCLNVINEGGLMRLIWCSASITGADLMRLWSCTNILVFSTIVQSITYSHGVQ